MVRKAALEECPIFVKGGSIIPMMAPGICLSDQMGEELYLDIYPDESGQVNDYLHYQDNGEDFAYLKGEYNLYRFGYKNKVCIEEMLHHGYCKKYKKVNKMNIDTKTNFLK